MASSKIYDENKRDERLNIRTRFIAWMGGINKETCKDTMIYRLNKRVSLNSFFKNFRNYFADGVNAAYIYGKNMTLTVLALAFEFIGMLCGTNNLVFNYYMAPLVFKFFTTLFILNISSVVLCKQGLLDTILLGIKSLGNAIYENGKIKKDNEKLIEEVSTASVNRDLTQKDANRIDYTIKEILKSFNSLDAADNDKYGELKEKFYILIGKYLDGNFKDSLVDSLLQELKLFTDSIIATNSDNNMSHREAISRDILLSMQDRNEEMKKYFVGVLQEVKDDIKKRIKR